MMCLKRMNIFINSIRSLCQSRFFIYSAIIYAITFIFILPVCLVHTKNSLYFRRSGNLSKSQELERKINNERIEKSEHFLNGLNATFLKNSIHKNQESQIDIVITIVSTSRNNAVKKQNYQPKYLTQAFSELLRQVYTEKSFTYNVKLVICNVDPDPMAFVEAHHLSKFTTVIKRYSMKTSVSSLYILEKEKQDYVFCLNGSLSYRPRYVMLIEDDALAKENFLPVLKHTIDMHLDRKYTNFDFYPARKNIAFVKFYHPERLLGFWSLDQERLTQMAGYCAVFTTVVYLFITHVLHARESYLLFTVILVYILLLLVSIGRANVDLWRNWFSPYLHSFSPVPSCCTQALLFPYSGARIAVNFLNNVICKKKYGKDSALDDMYAQTKTTAYIVQPNTFQHIGIYSTLHARVADPIIVV